MYYFCFFRKKEKSPAAAAAGLDTDFRIPYSAGAKYMGRERLIAETEMTA